MSERVIPKTSEGGRPAYRITCHECGCSDAVVAANAAASLPPEMIRKKFQQRGWIFGGSARGDTCPGCRLKRAPPRGLVLKLAGSNESLPVGVIEMPKDTVVPIKADAPRTMSRDDRRIIFSKLEAVYLDEKRGYDEGWTDERVSKDLGVPRAWVVTVRDENFGPVITVDVEAIKAENEFLKAHLIEQQTLAAQMVDRLGMALHEAETMRDRLAACAKNWKSKGVKAA